MVLCMHVDMYYRQLLHTENHEQNHGISSLVFIHLSSFQRTFVLIKNLLVAIDTNLYTNLHEVDCE